MPLPTFLIVGAPRAGTTTLAAYFAAHPEVWVSTPKELHFFTLRFDRGRDWYERQFPGEGAAVQRGEATPSYMMSPLAVQRMKELVPDARLIISLRDPVDRAYSHYWFNRWRGIERLSFEEALAAEDSRLQRDPADTRFAYVRMGEYAEQLTNLWGQYPAEQVHTVFFEDLKSRRDELLVELFRFLGVSEQIPTIPRSRRNHFGPPRSVAVARLSRALPGPAARTVRSMNTLKTEHPPMRPETRRRLVERFAEANRDLPSLLGAAPPWGPASGAQKV